MGTWSQTQRRLKYDLLQDIRRPWALIPGDPDDLIFLGGVPPYPEVPGELSKNLKLFIIRIIWQPTYVSTDLRECIIPFGRARLLHPG